MGAIFSSRQNHLLQPQPSHCSVSYTPVPLATLPLLSFLKPAHFTIKDTTITRTDVDQSAEWRDDSCHVIISEPFSSGIVSITTTILAFPSPRTIFESICFGVMNSSSRIPKIGKTLGYDVKNSVGLNSSGYLYWNTPSSPSSQRRHIVLKEGDCVRIEVDLESTPRTVQFFVNGQAVDSYVSGIPSSVLIGFSVCAQGTSFRIDNISHLSRPTPISEEMEEIEW